LRRCRGVHCRNHSKSCKWVGVVVEKTPQYKCRFVRLRNHKNAKRKRCCSFIRYCFGKKCRNSKKQCKWIGETKQKRVTVTKKWIKIKKFFVKDYKSQKLTFHAMDQFVKL